MSHSQNRRRFLGAVSLGILSSPLLGRTLLAETFNGAGLLKRWPDGGPNRKWRTEGIGEGYATVSIADDRIYTAGNIDADTVITAMDMSGKILWQAKNGPAYRRSFPGARATPMIADGELYHLGADGDLACLDAATGQRIWSLNILDKFDGRNTIWGLSESVLIDGDRVIAQPGGKEIGVVALDRLTGKTIWKCTGIGDQPGYTAPIIVDYAGLRQYITLTSAAAVGISTESGKLLWRYEHPVRYDVNIVTPIYHDGHVALFGTWGRGATQLKLNVDSDRCKIEEVWRTEELDNEHGGVVLVDGYLYGHADGNHRHRHWACLDWRTGKTAYSVPGLPVKRSATTTYADGMLYLVSDQGEVALVEATPDQYEITSRFRLPMESDSPAWAHPVIREGIFYLRHGSYLYAYDIRR